MKKALLISCFDWYQARLKTVREVLMQEGYEVTVLLGDFQHVTKEQITMRAAECTYIHVPPYEKNLSANRIYSHLVFGREVKKYLWKLMPDLVWLLLPPNNTAKYCSAYRKKNPETVYINDIIDLWPESMPLRSFSQSLPANVWRNWRISSLRTADHVFTECDYYKETLQKETESSKISPLYLFKERSPQQKEKIRKIIASGRKDENAVRLAFVGSINHIIDIEGICGVISRFSAEGLKVRLDVIGDGERRGLFLEKASEAGCSVNYHGKIFDEIKKIDILAGCDYGINMIRDTLQIGLSIKSIDYLSMGLPLLNSVGGDTARMAAEDHIGVNIRPDRNWFGELSQVLTRDKIFAYYEDHFSEDSFKRQLTEPLRETFDHV